MRTATRVRLLRVNVQAGSAAQGEPRVRSFQAATVATLLASTVHAGVHRREESVKVQLELALQRNGKSDRCAWIALELAGIHALAGCALELCLSPAEKEEP